MKFDKGDYDQNLWIRFGFEGGMGCNHQTSSMKKKPLGRKNANKTVKNQQRTSPAVSAFRLLTTLGSSYFTSWLKSLL